VDVAGAGVGGLRRPRRYQAVGTAIMCRSAMAENSPLLVLSNPTWGREAAFRVGSGEMALDDSLDLASISRAAWRPSGRRRQAEPAIKA
jgi:hypothetical protein